MSDERYRVAKAIMEARVKWGWTFGKKPQVMAVDELMADAAIEAMRLTTPQGSIGEKEYD